MSEGGDYIEETVSFDPIYLKVRPATATPVMSLLTLSDEELNRLGDTFTYVCQSNLKLNSNENIIHDWKHNYRIGVFNNAISHNVYSQLNFGFKWYYGKIEYMLPGNIDFTGCTFHMEGNAQDCSYIMWLDKLWHRDYEWSYDSIKDITNNTLEINAEDLIDSDETEYSIFLIAEKNGEIYWKQEFLVVFNHGENTDVVDNVIDNTDYANLTPVEIFENAEYWSENPVTTIDNFENIECPFVYNKDYPLYILIVGDYLEGNPTENIITFTEPAIIEKDTYTGYEQNGLYPIKILDLIGEDETTTAELTLNEMQESESIVFYQLPLSEGFGTNDTLAIRGIEIQANIEQTDNLVIYARVKNPNGETGSRSIILDDTDLNLSADNILSIGGVGDLWSFSTLDITNLDDWEFELKVLNTLNNTISNINFGDVNIIFYVETIEEQEYACFVEGENVAFYGAYLIKPDIPFGLETDVDYLTIDGTDTNDAYRQNITKKEIELKFGLDNCNLENSTVMLQQLIKLLTNERDKLNRPIPKRIEFSHLPKLYAEYILRESIDPEILISDYEFTVKLEIPAGTFYNKESTTTSNIGFVQGLAAVNPVIIILVTDTSIELLESKTNQKFNISADSSWIGKIIEIDCEDRILWLKETEDDPNSVNISSSADFNVDWFRLHGEYNFQTVGCALRTVDFVERW